MRVVTMLTAAGEAILVGANIRFGIGNSIVDNTSAGGISVGIDPATGGLKKYAHAMNCRRYTQHPTSGFTFEGFQIPGWPAVLQAALSIQRILPFSKIAGFDICVDENGRPVLIEINGLPDLVPMEQLNGPLLANRRTLQAFAEYDLLPSQLQRDLLNANPATLPEMSPAS